MSVSQRRQSDERRKGDRVDAQLNLNLHIDIGDEDISGGLETVNVSSSGVYFRCPRYIEPMTKLSLSFEVSVDGGVAPVECEGIVARIVPDHPGPEHETYEVAVFFTTIDTESLHNLERYVEGLLTA